MAGNDMRSGTPDRRQRSKRDRDAADSKREVLLVDDDTELRDAIRFGLESAGYTVDIYNNGPEALNAMLAMPRDAQPRLLLLAIDLPGLDGHTLHEQLKRLRPRGFIVVFISVRSSDLDQVRASAAGALDFLVKPVSIPVLLGKVEVWFNECKRDS